jgi:SAM-dependent methyltransferase
VGLDADPVHVAMASEFVASRRLSNVEVVVADARHTGLEPGSFDLVHARTLLVTIPEPAEVLGELVRLARPGGWVAGLEPDPDSTICYPPHPAVDRLCELFNLAFARNGADPRLGRRMAALYRDARLEDVRVEARATVYPVGHSRRTRYKNLAPRSSPTQLRHAEAVPSLAESRGGQPRERGTQAVWGESGGDLPVAITHREPAS